MPKNRVGRSQRCVFHFITGALMVLLLTFSACLEMSEFEGDIAQIKINGEFDVYKADKAVLWVINMTNTVEVEKLSIKVNDHEPKDWFGVPKPGTSHVSYHNRPTGDNTAAYKYTINVKVKGQDEAFTVNKTLPEAKDYAIYLVRKANGVLMLLDEPEDLSDLSKEDTSSPPEPFGLRFPLIVRNHSKSAYIVDVEFNDMPHSHQIDPGDQYPYFLHDDSYSTYIKYKICNTEEEGKTHVQTVVIIRTEINEIQPTYLEFYKTLDGKYAITQSWPPGDLDAEKEYHGDASLANVRVLNTLSTITVDAIAIQPEVWESGTPPPIYKIRNIDFVPRGVIGEGSSWERDAKTAKFMDGFDDEGKQAAFEIKDGYPYTVILYYSDDENNAKEIKFKGRNLYLGMTIDILVTKAHEPTVPVPESESE